MTRHCGIFSTTEVISWGEPHLTQAFMNLSGLSETLPEGLGKTPNGVVHGCLSDGKAFTIQRVCDSHFSVTHH